MSANPIARGQHAPAYQNFQFLNQIADHESGNPISAARNAFSTHILFSDVTPLYYNKRLQVSFVIAGEFKKFFGLIRGLVELNNNGDLKFKFSYDRESASLKVALEQSFLPAIQSFFHRVSALLFQEISFRNSLKKAMDLESRYKAQLSRMYESMNQFQDGSSSRAR